MKPGDISNLKQLLLSNEEWLMERILKYAKQQEYTKYTSTLVEAWRLSISGLSKAIIKTIETSGQIPQFKPEEDYSKNPIAAFAIEEARLHRERGISLNLFLGLLKYYRQTYQDLIREKIEENNLGELYGKFIVRNFDLFELALCVEWNSLHEDTVIKELQSKNRDITNEKNRYLSLFESLSDPIFLLDAENRIERLNFAATRLVGMKLIPGETYYSKPDVNEKNIKTGLIPAWKDISGKQIGVILPWIASAIKQHESDTGKIVQHEISARINTEQKTFLVSISRMLDVSDKYEGSVVVLSDMSERKQMEDKIRKLASTDYLTGIHNRRSFMGHANTEWNRSLRHKLPLTALMMDIDYFKHINDAYGHHMGDLTLQVFSNICISVLRQHDLLGRIGGEEFAALLIQTNLEDAIKIARRIREEVASTKVIENHISFHFNVSIGVSQVSLKDKTIEATIQRADQALYQAKRQGRNQVVSI